MLCLPECSKGRKYLLIFSLFAFYPFVRDVRLSADRIVHGDHPIEILHNFYSAKYEVMLQNQSMTLEDAQSEYRRRYYRQPPDRFEGWFEYAQNQQSPVIDDFDTIDNSLKPFWQFSGAELRKNLEAALTAHDSHLASFAIAQGVFKLDRSDWYGTQIANALGYNSHLVQHLPDVQIALNNLDEPRVLLSEYAGPEHIGQERFHDASYQPSWHLLTASCQSSPQAETPPVLEAIRSFGLPFIIDPANPTDLCLHPDYEHMHGFLTSPTTMLYTDSPVPIFSQSKLSPFADVSWPSPFYTGKYDQGEYNDLMDPEWSSKRNRLAWAGSTTGSQSVDNETWHSSHRQRFVAMMNALGNGSETFTFLIEENEGVWRTVHSRELLSQLYDVKFTAIIQCQEDICEDEKDFFHPSDREEHSALYQSRFLFDIDGNAFSGRFYSLLGSRSLVLKQTLFREWHDDRLVPWVHYVPISLSMEELPEVMRFLALTKRGGEVARRIAERGREWKERALRREDFGVYWYRLVLEYARLMDVRRPAGEYDPVM